MKIAVISDIHGNYQALLSVLQDIDSLGVEEIISLGDNIGYGPEPDAVVRTLMARNIFSLLGNHEQALLHDQYFRRLNPGSQKSLEITRNLLSAASFQYIETLPRWASRFDGRFVHGCPPGSVTAYILAPRDKMLRKIFNSFPEAMGFFGHTHDLQFYEMHGDVIRRFPRAVESRQLHQDGRYLVNCGSVGQPRDGLDNRAKYVLWDTAAGRLEIRAVAYDVQKTVARIYQLGFPDFNAERLL